MKRLLLISCVMLLTGGWLFAQSPVGYEVKPADGTDQVLMQKAIQKCSFDAYRMPDRRVELKFTDGAIIELWSAKEMKDAGHPVNMAALNQTGIPNRNTFSLHPDGYISETVPVRTKEDMAKDYLLK